MEQIKILVFALVSFLSQEDHPIGAKSAEIYVNRQTKQIRLCQYDLYSLEQYRDRAKTALDILMRTTQLVPQLSPIRMTSKTFYEDDGKLNAILYLDYKNERDLRNISIYADSIGNWSYPHLEEYGYSLKTGSPDERYVRFSPEEDLHFTMERKEYLFDGMYSLLEAYEQLRAARFIPMQERFSAKDFKRIRNFIFKNGDRKTFRNFDNHNPHYRFNGFDVYLGTGDQRGLLLEDEVQKKAYIELIIRADQNHTLYLGSKERANSGNGLSLAEGNVYWHNSNGGNEAHLIAILKEIKTQMDK
ncbi:hypothetical protein [Maribacter sp. 2-571]|uniref:hypothetical protein n=1 Tax=Maribacter sp. 2-571 TaxID=3417569 RepID=UPI003D356EB1